MDWEQLIDRANEARKAAYAPYSSFAVGAAVLTESGAVYCGCNVENRSFGLTVCAERVAIQNAVAAGERRLRAAVVVTDASPPAPPCGPCREVLTEFADGEMPLLLINVAGERREFQLQDLFPEPFRFPPPSKAR